MNSRRIFILPGLIAGLAAAAAHAESQKPNVLFIVLDDLNDWINCYGGYPGGSVHTPNMDRLAGESLLFERAYCPISLCNPSRTAILTGRRPSSSGIYGNVTWFRDFESLKDLTTLPQYFRSNGYTTVSAGKVFHHQTGKMSDPVSWDSISTLPSATPRPKEANPLGIHFTSSYHETELRYGAIPQKKEECGDYKQAGYCADFLSKKQDKPFFLAYGIIRPHAPFFAPQEYFDRYPLDQIVLPEVPKDDYDDLPGKAGYYKARDVHKIIADSGAWKYYVQAYLACISFADDCVGRVLDALDKSPYRDNTIVVLLSDNGFHLGEKQHWEKYTLWEPAARTLLMIKAPGITTPGTRTKCLVDLMDVNPTLTSLAGLPAQENIEARDLTPVLRHPETEWDQPVLTTWFPNNHSLRSAQYRYIRYEDATEELYDMAKDPEAFKNLANNPEYAGEIQKMRKWLPATNRESLDKIP